MGVLSDEFEIRHIHSKEQRFAILMFPPEVGSRSDDKQRGEIASASARKEKGKGVGSSKYATKPRKIEETPEIEGGSKTKFLSLDDVE